MDESVGAAWMMAGAVGVAGLFGCAYWLSANQRITQELILRKFL